MGFHSHQLEKMHLEVHNVSQLLSAVKTLMRAAVSSALTWASAS